MTSDREQTLLEHLAELRDRLVKCVIALIVGTVAAMFFAERAIQFLTRPLDGAIPQTIYPTESLMVYFRIAFIGGLALAMPVLVYQIAAFLLPGLLPEERKYLYFLTPGATICFIGGVLFAILVVLPVAIHFLQGFLSTVVENRWTLDEYVSWLTKGMFAMGIVFQLPLVLIFLSKVGIVTVEQLRSFRKYAVLLTSVVAAIVTTPDPLDMFLVMVPLYLLYELGMILVVVLGGKTREPETA